MSPTYLGITMVHPKISGEVYVVRFLSERSADPWAAFEGVCTVDTTGKTARIYGMCGRVRLRHLQDLAQWFLDTGITEVRAHRAPLHVLPGAVRDGDWMVINVSALNQRWQR